MKTLRAISVGFVLLVVIALVAVEQYALAARCLATWTICWALGFAVGRYT